MLDAIADAIGRDFAPATPARCSALSTLPRLSVWHGNRCCALRGAPVGRSKRLFPRPPVYALILADQGQAATRCAGDGAALTAPGERGCGKADCNLASPVEIMNTSYSWCSAPAETVPSGSSCMRQDYSLSEFTKAAKVQAWICPKTSKSGSMS